LNKKFLLVNNTLHKVDSDRDVVMWESCGIAYYLLDLFDPEEKLGPRKSDPKFLSALHQFTFYVSGTVDNLSAISSPIQRVLEDKKPGENPDLVDLVKILLLSST